MASKRPAKIASQKKGRGTAKSCPVCQTDMQMSKIVRFSDGPKGMVWLCTSNSCLAVVTKNDVHVGSLNDQAA